MMEAFPQEIQNSIKENFVFRLYVAGNTYKSTHAVLTMRRLCDEHLEGRYRLDVVDIYQNPAATREDQIIATPTVVKSKPEPRRKFVGDLSGVDGILTALGLTKKSI